MLRCVARAKSPMARDAFMPCSIESPLRGGSNRNIALDSPLRASPNLYREGQPSHHDTGDPRTMPTVPTAVIADHIAAVNALGVDAREQELHGCGTVLMLGTLALRRHHQPRRNVRDADGGFDLVHVLPALAPGTERVHCKFVGRNHDLLVVFLHLRN